jgi:hypothetical protein
MSTTPDEIGQKWNRTRTHCTATNKDGSECKAWAVSGTDICRKHGADQKSLQQLSKVRLFGLLPEALEQLQKIIRSPLTRDADRLKAIELVMNRTGFGPRAELTVEAKPYEDVLDSILVEVPALNAGEVVVDAELVPGSDPDYERSQELYDQTIEDAKPNAPVVPITSRVAVDMRQPADFVDAL